MKNTLRRSAALFFAVIGGAFALPTVANAQHGHRDSQLFGSPTSALANATSDQDTLVPCQLGEDGKHTENHSQCWSGDISFPATEQGAADASAWFSGPHPIKYCGMWHLKHVEVSVEAPAPADIPPDAAPADNGGFPLSPQDAIGDGIQLAGLFTGGNSGGCDGCDQGGNVYNDNRSYDSHDDNSVRDSHDRIDNSKTVTPPPQKGRHHGPVCTGPTPPPGPTPCATVAPKKRFTDNNPKTKPLPVGNPVEHGAPPKDGVPAPVVGKWDPKSKTGIDPVGKGQASTTSHSVKDGEAPKPGKTSDVKGKPKKNGSVSSGPATTSAAKPAPAKPKAKPTTQARPRTSRPAATSRPKTVNRPARVRSAPARASRPSGGNRGGGHHR